MDNEDGTEKLIKRERIINKLREEYSYMGVISDGGMIEDFMHLFDKHSLAGPVMREYHELINVFLFFYKTQPNFVKAIHKILPDWCDHDSVQLRLLRLAKFFKSFEETLHGYDSIACIEYRRLEDHETKFTEDELTQIENEYWKNFLFYSDET